MKAAHNNLRPVSNYDNFPLFLSTVHSLHSSKNAVFQSHILFYDCTWLKLFHAA